MKFIIDNGTGCGHIEGCEGLSLKEALAWIEENTCSYGMITIFNSGSILRCFDYDVYNNNQFYHNLEDWHYTLPVKKIIYDYCFMNKDIEIYI